MSGAVRYPVQGSALGALVDAADVPLLAGYRWALSGGYARAHRGDAVLWMHRLLCPSDGLVDHINGDKLDNRRANLRPATARQNVANSRSKVRGSSRHRGVSLLRWPTKQGERTAWRADASPGRHQIYLGMFGSEDEAALAYNVAALLLNGAYARLNEVPPTVALSAEAQRGLVERLHKHVSAIEQAAAPALRAAGGAR